MGFLKWFLSGLAGATVGGILWVALSYYANVEAGYVALAIGVLAGWGVRALANDDEVGTGPGFAAILAAVLLVVAARWVSCSLMFDREAQKFDAIAVMTDFGHEDLLGEFATEIADDRVAKGEAIKWPEGVDREVAFEKEHFPAEIWQEAEERLSAMSTQEKDARVAAAKAGAVAAVNQLNHQMKVEFFKSTLGFYDLIWIALAMTAAFRTGSGPTSEETAEPAPEPV